MNGLSHYTVKYTQNSRVKNRNRQVPLSLQDPSEKDRRVRQIVLQEQMIFLLKQSGDIRSPQVEAAFRAVPRHVFLPGAALEKAYSFREVITHRQEGVPVSSSSQTTTMAMMLEQLDLSSGMKVLEVGAGTGFNAGLLAHLVGERGEVVTLDIDPEIVETARKNLAAAGLGRVQVVCGDGFEGYPQAGPYDRIVLTVGAWDIAPAWRDQLKPEGRLLVPLWIQGEQRTILFAPSEEGLESVSLVRCGFVRLRGVGAGPESFLQLDPQIDFMALVDERHPTTPQALYDLFTSPSRERKTEFQVTYREVFEDLSLWLAVHDSNFFILHAEGEAEEIAFVPDLYGVPGRMHVAYGLREEGAACVLIRSPQPSPENASPFDLHLRSYGPDTGLEGRLLARLRAWDAAGRPASERVKIRAYPVGEDSLPSPDEVVIAKKWMKYGFRWQEGRGLQVEGCRL